MLKKEVSKGGQWRERGREQMERDDDPRIRNSVLVSGYQERFEGPRKLPPCHGPPWAFVFFSFSLKFSCFTILC